MYIMINFCSFLFFFHPILKNETMIFNIIFDNRHIWIKTSYKTPLLLYFLSDYIGYGLFM